MRRFMFGVGLLVVAALICVPQAGWAQSSQSTGQITGSVMDNDGGVLPGVTVEARNPATGFSRAAITDTDGFYRLDLLPSGTYDVKAVLSGFQTEVQRAVQVSLGSSVRIDYKLHASTVAEEIVVTAEAPIIETTNPSVASTVGNEQIANLPLQGRDFTDFAILTPGAVAADNSQQGGRGGLNIGARAIQNSFNIDGSNSQSNFFGEERGGTRPPFTFSQAAIKEFQVVKSSYNLQFNSSGGVINAVTKSGTNELKGEAFYYYRDDSFVEEDARGFDSNNFEQKQFGFALGGPVIKDKLHFFVSYDGQRYTTPYLAVFRDFPTDRTAEWEAMTGLNYANETGEIDQTNDADVYLAKLDWQLSDNNLLTIRDNYSKNEGENLTSSYSNTGRSNNGLEENKFNSFVASLNSVISEDAFNELIVQVSKEERPRTANTTETPEVGIYRYRAAWGQNNFLPNFLDEDHIQVIDNFTYYMGEHTFKAGINFDLTSFDDGFFRYGGGSYSFSSWDDFFNNDPFSYTQSFSDYDGKVKFDTNYYSAYVQDEWRTSPNFTLTYGLRWDMQDHDKPKETNPLFPNTGDIPNDTDNFAPRVGFAWDINGDGKSVLRGGAGYFYDNTPTLLDANAMLANGVRVIRVSNRCAYDECPTYPGRWNSLGDLEGATPDIFVYDPNFENPETWRLSAGYEKEILTDLSVGVDVIYSQTKKLERKLDRNIADNGGLTPDGLPTYDRHANYDGLDQIMQFTSDAKAKYKAIVLKARKRYSHGWMLDASYTWSEATDTDSNERSVSSSSSYPMDQFNLEGEWGPSNFDATHKFVLSATYQLPYGFMVSGIIYYRSGFPYSAMMDGWDSNTDGYTRNERALVETSPGVWYRYKRNTYNQPDFKNMDLRLSKTFSFGEDYELELIAEIFNVTNEANWTTRNTTLISYDWGGTNPQFEDNFGQGTDVGDPRSYQLGMKFRF